jgi:hypothetical protein
MMHVLEKSAMVHRLVAGLEIDMSMIFKNAGNTGVCPKCGTIFEGKERGLSRVVSPTTVCLPAVVLIFDGKVPGCKILFHTRDKRPQHKTDEPHQKYILGMRLADGKEIAKAKIDLVFKRIIIRVLETPQIHLQHELPDMILGENYRATFKKPPKALFCARGPHSTSKSSSGCHVWAPETR